jgi:hypothetical protein
LHGLSRGSHPGVTVAAERLSGVWGIGLSRYAS